MPRSMTGYAKASTTISQKQFSVEIHSVNKRGLDLHLQLPKEYLFLDIELRKWIAAVASRGQVTFRITTETSTDISTDLLQRVDVDLQTLAQAVGFKETRPYDFAFLLQEAAKYTSMSVSTDLIEQIEPIVKEALKIWNQAKEKEGIFLIKDISNRLDHITKLRNQILSYKEKSSTRLQERLTKALEELETKLLDEDRRRILKEVVLYVEKADISEELARLEAHLEQFGHLITSQKMEVGKNLDFFVQEMLREANTIAAKANDAELIHYVVEMKGELEKIREQVQNIE